MSFKNLLEPFGDTSIERVEAAIEALKKGRGVLVVDNENRENEGDLIYAAETVTDEQMAFMIRECSGIVCVCISKEQAQKMQLPMMVEHNTSVYGTAFTISIDAAHQKSGIDDIRYLDEFESFCSDLKGLDYYEDDTVPDHQKREFVLEHKQSLLPHLSKMRLVKSE